jgi:hypothetical protein
MQRSEVLREFFDRLADNFKIPDHCVEGFLILQERLLGKAPGIGHDFSSRLESIFQVDPRIPRHRRLLVG